VKGKDEIAIKLIGAGADINLPDKYGKTPLIFAMSKDRLKIFQLLIEKVDLDLKNEYGKTALMLAIMNGEDEIANKLIEYWNLAISFEEIEFLMRNIEQMIPIYEIGFVEKSTMIFHNVDLIDRTDCYKKSFNKDHLGLLRMLKEKNFNPGKGRC
jgi:hypothetical protein